MASDQGSLSTVVFKDVHIAVLGLIAANYTTSLPNSGAPPGGFDLVGQSIVADGNRWSVNPSRRDGKRGLLIQCAYSVFSGGTKKDLWFFPYEEIGRMTFEAKGLIL